MNPFSKIQLHQYYDKLHIISTNIVIQGNEPAKSVPTPSKILWFQISKCNPRKKYPRLFHKNKTISWIKQISIFLRSYMISLTTNPTWGTTFYPSKFSTRSITTIKLNMENIYIHRYYMSYIDEAWIKRFTFHIIFVNLITNILSIKPLTYGYPTYNPPPYLPFSNFSLMHLLLLFF